MARRHALDPPLPPGRRREEEVAISVRLPASLLQALRAEAHARTQELGVAVSVAALVRQAVRERYGR